MRVGWDLTLKDSSGGVGGFLGPVRAVMVATGLFLDPTMPWDSGPRSHTILCTGPLVIYINIVY